MTNIIQTEELAYAYPAGEDTAPVQALQGVNLSIEQGSFTVVLGHNGSGKSTLAKHMNAVLLPAGGTVWVDGMDTKDEALLLEIRRRVGMVFQNPDNQIVANVVEEDVGFGPENLGVPTEEIQRRVAAALQAVGMDHTWTSSPSTPPTTSPADRSSALPLPGSSPWNRPALSWTSPPPCWTPADGGRCWIQSGG